MEKRTRVEEDLGWMHWALCQGGDPEDWFASATSEAQARARATCAECPVREKCLEYSYTFGLPEGIWGGLDEEERRLERRARSARRRRAAGAAG